MSIEPERVLTPQRVVIVGAGIGGLAAAAELAACGVEVVLLERADAPGGKMRQVVVGGRPIDSGPTVITMRFVFEALFDAAGASFGDAVGLERLGLVARHGWPCGTMLDLFADPARTIEAIGDFAGAAEAQGYARFCADAEAMFEFCKEPFLFSERATPLSFVSREGLTTLRRIKALETLWGALGDYFRDPRLRQLFARYATYCGSSPFEAPATLMLIAHVERSGCWSVKGGVYAIAEALAALARSHGAEIRTGAEVTEILTRHGAAAGVRLATGETIAADAVVSNAETAALGSGALGPAAGRAVAAPSRGRRSLSGMSWSMLGRLEGLKVPRHSVFFGSDYRLEFRDLFRRRRVPAEPTVYLCAQDRGEGHPGPREGPERLFALINAPANGDTHTYTAPEIEACRTRAFALMNRCGLTVSSAPEMTVATSPSDFARMFPATGGALYGSTMHGWAAATGRPPARTRLPGLYIVGASAHPGPGVPMVALSARKATAAILSDLASRRRSRPGATVGGMSTP